MATATYTPISTTTLTSTTATITFSSIPGTYTDLKLIINAVTATSNGTGILRFNSDSAGNYSRTYLNSDGTSVTSSSGVNGTRIYFGPQTNGISTTPSLVTVDIFSYAGSTYKSCLVSNSADKNGSGETEISVQMWRSTSAITTISLEVNGQSFGSGTTATLYGITKA